MESEELIRIHATYPDISSARIAAKDLVEKRLAACVQMIPINSIYRWEEELNDDSEVLIIIKTIKSCYPVIEERLLNAHPYDLPEIISFGVDGGYERYLEWIRENTSAGKPE